MKPFQIMAVTPCVTCSLIAPLAGSFRYSVVVVAVPDTVFTWRMRGAGRHKVKRRAVARERVRRTRESDERGEPKRVAGWEWRAEG